MNLLLWKSSWSYWILSDTCGCGCLGRAGPNDFTGLRWPEGRTFPTLYKSINCNSSSREWYGLVRPLAHGIPFYYLFWSKMDAIKQNKRLWKGLNDVPRAISFYTLPSTPMLWLENTLPWLFLELSYNYSQPENSTATPKRAVQKERKNLNPPWCTQAKISQPKNALYLWMYFYVK